MGVQAIDMCGAARDTAAAKASSRTFGSSRPKTYRWATSIIATGASVTSIAAASRRARAVAARTADRSA